jgi:hypothetical protein
MTATDRRDSQSKPGGGGLVLVKVDPGLEGPGELVGKGLLGDL